MTYQRPTRIGYNVQDARRRDYELLKAVGMLIGAAAAVVVLGVFALLAT